MSSTPPSSIPANVLTAWEGLGQAEIRPLGTGLINATFLAVGAGRPLVLQRLHQSFDANVNVDLDTVTALLHKRGMTTPRLVKTKDGSRETVDADGHLWRAQTYVPGQAFDKLQSTQHATEAGALVADFHGALFDADIHYQKERRHAHLTASHLRFLESTLDAHRDHRLYAEVAPLADAVLAALDPLPDFSRLPERHAHGDLKISNLLFDDKGQGLCLVDLDTLAPMVWPHEMGDAFRSWCNRSGEDHEGATFDLAFFRAALEGYARQNGAALTDDERGMLVEGIRTICLELAARFLADALNASYFGWDPDRFPTRADHNLVRGRGQLALAMDLDTKRSAAEQVVENAFSV